jgi:hypothetical protein
MPMEEDMGTQCRQLATVSLSLLAAACLVAACASAPERHTDADQAVAADDPATTTTESGSDQDDRSRDADAELSQPSEQQATASSAEAGHQQENSQPDPSVAGGSDDTVRMLEADEPGETTTDPQSPRYEEEVRHETVLSSIGNGDRGALADVLVGDEAADAALADVFSESSGVTSSERHGISTSASTAGSDDDSTATTHPGGRPPRDSEVNLRLVDVQADDEDYEGYVDSVLNRQRRTHGRCLRNSREQCLAGEGLLQVTFQVSSAGRTEDLEVVESSFDEAATDCLLTRFSRTRYPRPRTSPVRIEAQFSCEVEAEEQ